MPKKSSKDRVIEPVKNKPSDRLGLLKEVLKNGIFKIFTVDENGYQYFDSLFNEYLRDESFNANDFLAAAQMLIDAGVNPELIYKVVELIRNNPNDGLSLLREALARGILNVYTIENGYTYMDVLFNEYHRNTSFNTNNFLAAAQILHDAGACPTLKEVIKLIKNNPSRGSVLLKKVLKKGILNVYTVDENGYKLLDLLLNEYLQGENPNTDNFLSEAQILLDAGVDPTFVSNIPNAPALLRCIISPEYDHSIFRLFIENILRSSYQEISQLTFAGLSSGQTSYARDHLNEELIFRYRKHDYNGIRLLLELGADVNYQDVNGNSLLHTVFRAGDQLLEERIDDLLIEYNIDPELINEAGFTPLEFARSRNLQHMIDRIENIIDIVNYDSDDDNYSSEESTLIDEELEKEDSSFEDSQNQLNEEKQEEETSSYVENEDAISAGAPSLAHHMHNQTSALSLEPALETQEQNGTLSVESSQEAQPLVAGIIGAYCPNAF